MADSLSDKSRRAAVTWAVSKDGTLARFVPSISKPYEIRFNGPEGTSKLEGAWSIAAATPDLVFVSTSTNNITRIFRVASDELDKLSGISGEGTNGGYSLSMVKKWNEPSATMVSNEGWVAAYSPDGAIARIDTSTTAHRENNAWRDQPPLEQIRALGLTSRGDVLFVSDALKLIRNL